MDHDLRPFRERYAGPWTVEGGDGCFVVRAACGARLAWVHYRDLPPEWRVGQFYALNEAEARAVALAIAGLARPAKKKARSKAGLPGQLDLPFN